MATTVPDNLRSSSFDEDDAVLLVPGENGDGVAPDSAGDIMRGTVQGESAVERATLARNENRIVAWTKAVVFVVLLVSTVLVCVSVARYIRADQKKDFELAFAADSAKLLDSFQDSIEQTLEAVNALSVSITSHALATGSVFPNVTLPHFGIRFADSRILSHAVFIQYHPIVTDETRAGWEAYQIENRDTYDESLETQTFLLDYQDKQFNQRDTEGAATVDTLGNSHLMRNLDPDFWAITHDTIMSHAEDGSLIVAPPGTGPYTPVWQVSPVFPTRTLVNTNSITHPLFTGSYTSTIESGKGALGEAEGDNALDTDSIFGAFLARSQFRFGVKEYDGDPTSAFSYPVFDSFDPYNRAVAGIIGQTFYWRLFFKDVLPPNTRGIICILENSRDQKITYRIDQHVTYLGKGDLHDPKYDRYKRTLDVGSKAFNAESKSFLSVGIDGTYCSYKLHIYPSQDNENAYSNDDAVILAVIIAAVSLFTSLIFVVYTIAVSRRQQVVMDRAVASSAIVSSLFPSQVRDQIYRENDTEKKKTWKAEEDGAHGFGSSRPIAELFDHTTVMFGDLVGFTSWSSSRTPVEVFELLETLYRSFDAIALQRKVFKVETIGDCYVAVTGLPEPQDDHAVIMVKFASDCMAKMGQLTTELVGSLGDDTALLAMRIGLHSGSVTGGVLRGQKSRFQLFGDTMNTAARMESNGKPGRIHVSQQTADKLIGKGKASWITQREDKIVAKGKGELQTYWVTPRSTTKSAETMSTSFTVTDDNAASIEMVEDATEQIEV
jgi:class 3 adenylate cyclase